MTAASGDGRRLYGKLAVITGGNSGIGLATATRMATEGAKVIIAGRDTDTLQEASQAIGDGVVTVETDVTDLRTIDELFATVARQGDGIDVLFVNAGIGVYAPLAEMTEADYDRVFAINTKGAFFTIHKAIPLLNDNGAVVVTSLAPITPPWRRPGTGAYAATKLALRALTQTAAAELAGRGIRVNAVAPGPISTPIFERTGLPKEQVDRRLSTMAQDIPLHRIGTPDEIASVVTFLASPDASYLTGQEIIVDGGLSTI